MRCDMFLKTTCLVKRRSLAKQLCDSKLIQINGSPAKASREIIAGDEMTIEYPHKIVTLKILEIPRNKNVSKAAARDLYDILNEEKKEDDFFQGM